MSKTDKTSIRRTLVAKRDSLSPEDIETKSELIKKRLFSLAEFEQADVILFFASFRSEVATHKMIKESLRAGKKTVLPRITPTPGGLELFQIKDFEEDLCLGPKHILEPKPEKTEWTLPKDIKLAVVPGVAFDQRGHRLGYGGGYFDRLLAVVDPFVPTIGLAFELQIVASLPTAAHDIAVTKIVTEKRIIDCR